MMTFRLCAREKIEDVLLALYKEPLNTNDLQMRGIVGGSTASRLLKRLKELGLVEPVLVNGSPKYKLTEKGRRVAELIMEIHKIVESDG